MTLQVRYLAFASLLAGMLALTAFTGGHDDRSMTRAAHVRIHFLSGIDRLDSTVAILQRTTTEGKRLPLSKLRREFRDARLAYKRIEFLVEFFDRHAAGKLNGVPLPKVVAGDPLRTVIEPQGFQVMEEIVFGEDPAGARAELAALIGEMRQNIAGLRRTAADIGLLDRYLLEAMRDQMVRIMTQTVAGFDAPASGNSIEEAAVSLDGLRSVATLYLEMLEDRVLAARIDRQITGAAHYLQANKRFETFDRIAFTREYGDPLYASLLDLHRTLGIELPSEASPFNRAIDYSARSIYDRSFLNPFFFSPDRFDRINTERVELGRTLFFDPVLSGDNSQSCASCHDPERAFTDGVPRSIAFHGEGTVARNSPTLLNAAFQNGFFHDSRSRFLEDQVEQVLLNGNEMRSSFESLVPKLNRSPDYREMFRRAYAGTSDTIITHNGIKQAIGSYMRTLVALDSPFDRFMRRETSAIDPAIRRGYNLFMGQAKCGTCHFAPIFNGTVPPFFTDTEIEVLGTTAKGDLTHPELDGDLGRSIITGDTNVRHGFRTPTVRNAGLTAPYMHNGGFTTLEQVIEFYENGGGVGLGLDVPNQTLPSDRLGLSARDKRDLILFLQSLTDTTGTGTLPKRFPRFPSDPEIDRRATAGAGRFE